MVALCFLRTTFFRGTKQYIAERIGHLHLERVKQVATFPLYVEMDQIYKLSCPASPVHYKHDSVPGI